MMKHVRFFVLKSFAIQFIWCKFATRIIVGGLYESFSRENISVCYSSCKLERRKFQNRIEKNDNWQASMIIVDVTCRLFTAIPTAATWTGFVHELCL